MKRNRDTDDNAYIKLANEYAAALKIVDEYREHPKTIAKEEEATRMAGIRRRSANLKKLKDAFPKSLHNLILKRKFKHTREYHHLIDIEATLEACFERDDAISTYTEWTISFIFENLKGETTSYFEETLNPKFPCEPATFKRVKFQKNATRLWHSCLDANEDNDTKALVAFICACAGYTGTYGDLKYMFRALENDEDEDNALINSEDYDMQ